jgi:hypothetical protein
MRLVNFHAFSPALFLAFNYLKSSSRHFVSTVNGCMVSKINTIAHKQLQLNNASNSRMVPIPAGWQLIFYSVLYIKKRQSNN